MELLKNVCLILKISSPLFHVEPGDKLSKPYPSHYPSSLLNFSLILIISPETTLQFTTVPKITCRFMLQWKLWTFQELNLSNCYSNRGAKSTVVNRTSYPIIRDDETTTTASLSILLFCYLFKNNLSFSKFYSFSSYIYHKISLLLLLYINFVCLGWCLFVSIQ